MLFWLHGNIEVTIPQLLYQKCIFVYIPRYYFIHETMHYCFHTHASGSVTLHNVFMVTHFISLCLAKALRKLVWSYNTFWLCLHSETVSPHFIKVNTKNISTICYCICNDKALRNLSHQSQTTLHRGARLNGKLQQYD